VALYSPCTNLAAWTMDYRLYYLCAVTVHITSVIPISAQSGDFFCVHSAAYLVFKAAMWIGIVMVPISIRIRLSILKLIRILPQVSHLLEDRIFILYLFTVQQCQFTLFYPS
jgi:hypothetical protein